MKYSMIFAMSPDFHYVLLLRKPDDHKNPLFRGRWTAPGGLIEKGESGLGCAVRELWEEARLKVSATDLVPVLKFLCNCDPTESEHEVFVYGVSVPIDMLLTAEGDEIEPVDSFCNLPPNTIWYVESLFELVKARMKQLRTKEIA